MAYVNDIPESCRREKPRTAEQWASDVPAALGLLAKNHTVYRGFDKELKARTEVAEYYVSHGGWNYPDLPLSVQNNPHLALVALNQNPNAVWRLPDFFLLPADAPIYRNGARRDAIVAYGAETVASVREKAVELHGAAKIDAHLNERSALGRY